MIPIGERIALDDGEISFAFVHASGPGGQNVNKVATAVQLRVAAAASPSLPPDVKARLARLAGRRMTKDGEIVIVARRHRTQERNRADALARLVDLLRRAAEAPPLRKPTRPPAAARRQRLAAKHHRAGLKALRNPVGEE
jgi:ribosome-associated protein